MPFASQPGPTPVVFERGAGPRLTDIDGHSYIDYVLGYGPLMLGHDPRDVIDAVKGSIESHLLLGGQHRLEARLGELVSTTVPSAEMACFSTTGSEAVAAALRIARAHTGRPLIAKFEGHYHGWLDGVAVNTPGTPAAAGTGEIEPLPSTGGVAVSDAVAVLRWNDEQALRRLVASRGGELAALILEPGASDGTDRAPARVPRIRDPVGEVGRRGSDIRRGGHRLPARTGRSSAALQSRA